MKAIILFVILMSSFSWADCQVSDGKKLYKIPDKSRLSLFEDGRSLSSHKIQDQDGLGTCYANATTAVLKSVLPSQPDISYLHAASSASTHGWLQEFNQKGQKYLQDEGSVKTEFVSGGWVCETIAGMKKAGGACPQDKSILETQTSVDPYVQGRLLRGLGAYFDHLNTIRKNPEKFEKLKEELAMAFEIINSEAQNLKQICEQRKQEKFPVEIPFKRFLSGAVSYFMNQSDDCSKSRFERIKTFLSSDSVIAQDRIYIDPSNETEAELTALIEGDPKISKALDEFVNSREVKSDELALLTNNLLPKFDQYLREKTDIDEKGLNCSDNYNNSFLLGTLPEEALKQMLLTMRQVKQSDCQMPLIQDDAAYHLLTMNEQQSCLASDSFQKMLDAIIPLASVGALLNQQLYGNLTDPKVAYAHQMVNAIMPGCLDKKNLLSLDNVSCASFSMCDQSQFIDMSNNTYTGPEGGCYTLSDAQYLVRMKAINSLKAGRAMAVGVCTGFMDDPKVRTKFCTKQAKGIDGHAYHEMTISGYRCNGGKIEYEILNSWGNYCPAENGVKNEALECEMNDDGLPNGRFWVKEEVLVDSMTDITSITVRK